jgi:signal transduction histidine kinase
MNRSKNMKKEKNTRKLVILMFMMMFIFGINAKSQDNKQIIIEKIDINGKAVTDMSKDIILSTQDSITFFYRLDNHTKESGAFLFAYKLKDSRDSVERSTNTNFLSYKNLPEEEYEFSVRAFDLRGNWAASPTQILFSVNNQKAALIKEIDLLKNEYMVKDSVLKSTEELLSKAESGKKLNIINILIGLIPGLLIGFSVMTVLKKKSNTTTNTGTNRMEKIKDLPFSEEEFQKILNENAEIKAELNKLRGQIDALNTRSDELRHQNYDLQKNVEKLKSKKDELEDLQKQKDELFTVIIHDIKNPVALIKSLVELLTSYDLSATEQHEIIKDIAETTNKIVSLSHEVSKILALESSVMKLNREEVDIRHIVNDVYQRNLIGAKNKSIQLYKDIADEMPNCNIDAFKIEDVIDNLLSNAIKFTQKEGTVRIKTYSEDNNVIVEVSDNGLGLTEEDIANAFKRGQRLSARPTAGESSTGLGLWIVKKLIQAHNGRVWVKSALGKGSTFAFSIAVSHEQV